jgi:hypothetical protein
MTPEQISRLLGGYATGNLTAAEEAALYAAALEDQDLFDALAREQSLRDLLRDPGARAHLLAALDGAKEPWYRRWAVWQKAAAVAMAVCLCAAVVIGIRTWRHGVARPQPVLLATANPPAAPAARDMAPPAPMAQAEAPAKVRPMPKREPVTENAPLRAKATAPAVVSAGQAAAPPPPPPDAAPAVTPSVRAPQTAVPPSQALLDQASSGPLGGAAAGFVSSGENLVGTVRDPSGAAIAGANLSLLNPATGTKLKAAADQRGNFRFVNLPVGSYFLTAESTGYRRSDQLVPVNANGPQRVDPVLQALAAETLARARTLKEDTRVRLSSIGMAGLSWSVWHRGPNGQLEKADAATLPAEEPVVLRLEALTGGSVSVLEMGGDAASFVVTRQIEPAKPLDIPLPPHKAGVQEFAAWISTKGGAVRSGPTLTIKLTYQ